MRITSTRNLSLSRADLEPLLRLVLIPVVCLLVGGICGLVYSLAQSTLYEARSQVVVSPATGFIDPAQSDAFPAISTTVQELALTRNVLQAALATMPKEQASESPSWLRSRLRLNISGDTPLLTIQGVDGSQSVATSIAKAEATALIKAINATATAAVPANATTPGTAATGVTLQAFSLGEPRGKVQPETGRNLLLGASAGLIIGCFVLAQLLSRRSRRSE
jgi:capsular polysaccharide biosynthesis protein